MKLDGINSSLQGYRVAESSLNARAERIAKVTTPAPAQVDAPAVAAKQAPDLTSDMAGLNTDRLAASYNLKAMKVQNSMLGDLLDILK